ncbi:MAG: peptidase domain-containing ABC transporter [Cyclobacteriaceae bacterium]|jgi:ATP-binding cassette subfamily B protein
MKFPSFIQPDSKDCGPACLKIISKYYDKLITISYLRALSETARGGTSLANLADAAEKIGFKSIGVKVDLDTILDRAPLPCIVFWRNSHFVVLYKITKKRAYISDPAYGLISYSINDFLSGWIGNNSQGNTKEGIALLLEPLPKFFDTKFDSPESKEIVNGFTFLYRYFSPYKKLFAQLVLGLFLGSLLQLIVPFLFQAVVDVGVNGRNIGLLYLILAGQLSLFLGRITIENIRSWVLLHFSTRVNVTLISDFFIKLMNLPIRFFDSKLTGDLLQRIIDHEKIEQFLTSSTLNTLFSLLNILTFGVVLAYYSMKIFLVYAAGAILYIAWILFFLKKRRELNYKRFHHSTDEQNKILEIINGMQEIKLNNSEKRKRWEWEFIQAKLFRVSLANLSLIQKQNIGSSFINELVTILITFISATSVISGALTLGTMISIQYIIGQLNVPLSQFVNFILSAQDAKVSLERLNEIHSKENEENPEDFRLTDISLSQDIHIINLEYKYSSVADPVLRNLNLVIPANKTTAIVGHSGSGKTTLLKLLMKFYEPTMGQIKLGLTPLPQISQRAYRKHCGVVMQEGFIFNDTIANNIAIGDDDVDKEKLYRACEVANILELIEGLPLGFNTRIGQDGVGLSVGEKQRILIARVVYKSPTLICFDEATSSLDANNEKIIVNNLNTFLKNKTAIVIAHRLSTVKNADQIVVLEKGTIVEIGTHDELLNRGGVYFNLVKNQLALEKIEFVNNNN